MRSKIITLDEYFSTGEPTVQLISTIGRGGRILREPTSLHKSAAIRSPAMDFINSVEPEEGRSTVLIVGLGDHETYGPNRNGDGFPSEPVHGKIAAHEVLPKHYQSYDNAHVYEHHANTDPAKAIGRVKKSFWNPHMRRVEVVEDFEHAKAPHLLEKIASGEYPAKSMGARIMYDVCTNCGNQARTRGEYCDHLKFAMSQIDSDTGIQNAALNPSPNFFDSSWVLRPADRTGYMLKKVANERPYEIRSSSELGDLREEIVEKAANIAKAADLEKVVDGTPEASVSNLDEKDTKLLNEYQATCAPDEGVGSDPDMQKIVRVMISYKPNEALGTSENMGLPLGIENLIKYFTGRMSNAPVEDKDIKTASRCLPTIIELYNEYPRFYYDVVKQAQLDEPAVINIDLAAKIANLAPSNVTQDYFYRQYLPEDFQANPRGRTDMVSWTDPQTGQQYQTNYGTVQKTNDALVEQGLKRKGLETGTLLGGGGLLGAASLALARRGHTLPALATGIGGAGLGAMGVGKLMGDTPIAGPKIRTDQGETISGWTEMRPKTGSILAPELRYLRHRNMDAAYTKQGCYRALLNKLSSFEIQDELSDLLGPTLDLTKVAKALGNAILKAA